MNRLMAIFLVLFSLFLIHIGMSVALSSDVSILQNPEPAIMPIDDAQSSTTDVIPIEKSIKNNLFQEKSKNINHINQAQISKNKIFVKNKILNDFKTDGKIRVIVTLKDPSKIASLNSDISNMKLSELNSFKSLIREQVILKSSLGDVKHRYSFVNGFSAEISEKEMNNLANDGLVESIELDEAVHSFLQDTVPLIEADKAWMLQTNGINLTGKGQSICMIDSGIDYTHPDLGGCTISDVSTVSSNPYSLTSANYPNQYPNNVNKMWTIKKTGYKTISVHFSEINTEENYDGVCLLDVNNIYLFCYSGQFTDLWTPSIMGDTLKVQFISDSSNIGGPYSGFKIDATIDVLSIPTSADWHLCSKVIGGTDFVNGDSDPMDDDGHGTHVAGIVSANGAVKGIAPDSTLVAVKVLDSTGSGYDSDILAGIDYCISNRQKYNISVISMSLGGNSVYTQNCDLDEPLFASAINSATENGISVAIATGNKGSTGIASPSCIQNAIPVTATAKNDTITNYANRNNLVKLAAPGGYGFGATGITSTWLGGGYISESGTSMATPHVSAAIAILNQYFKSNGQTKTPKELEEILSSSGKIIHDTLTDGNYSRIDIYNALLSQDLQSPITIAENLDVWHNFAFNVTLSASDNLGILYTTYAFNDTQFNNTLLSITQDGNYNITYYSVDKAGNIEEIKNGFALLDTISPILHNVTLEKKTVRSNTSVITIVNASDENALASVSVNNYSLNLIDGLWTGNVSFNSSNFVVIAKDVAGNIIEENSTVTIDDILPVITSNNIENGQVFFQSLVSFNITLNGTGSSILGWQIILDDQDITSNVSCKNILNDSQIATCSFNHVFIDGIHNIYIDMHDDSEFFASSNITFFVDMDAPLVSILYPLNNQTYVGTTGSMLKFNFSSSDINGVDSCWYDLSGIINSTNPATSTNHTNITANHVNIPACNSTQLYLQSGEYVIIIYANDTFGKMGNDTVSFNIDDISSPIISSPLPNGSKPSTTTSTVLSINTDENATCRYSASKNDTYDMMNKTFNDSITKHTKTISVSSGTEYIFYVLCKDMSSNINNESVNITFNIATPPPVIIKKGGGGGGGGGGGYVAPANTTNSTNNTNSTKINSNINTANSTNSTGAIQKEIFTANTVQPSKESLDTKDVPVEVGSLTNSNTLEKLENKTKLNDVLGITGLVTDKNVGKINFLYMVGAIVLATLFIGGYFYFTRNVKKKKHYR